ncbi:Smr domain-containing protein [Erysiphe neolycopersici]|uniref:Smr domain-containing protein n=1 Tax=Erysiphe neolycopersici TaxID=212602 RepID=A0A420HK62_9PEZI|nr:Smr domain-containing protein [Erysiphe neolycopersici]
MAADKYTSFIDTSIILAILSDYDLTDPAQKANAQNTLEFIREGTKPDKDNVNLKQSLDSSSNFESRASVSDDGAAIESLQDWNTQTGDSSSSSVYPDDNIRSPYLYSNSPLKFSDENIPKIKSSVLDGLTEKGQENALIAMFPALKVFDITHTLQKCNGDADKAIDELITQSFLEETGDRCRSVNGFATNDESQTYWRRKAKKKRKKEALGVVNENTFTSPTPKYQSCWDIGLENIQFLADRINIPKSQISSLYHETGASLPQTISCLMQSKSEKTLKMDDDITLAHLYQLADDFPSMPMSQIKKIYELTQNNFCHTRDLLQAYSIDDKQKISNGSQITFRHTPINSNSEKNIASMKKSINLNTNLNIRRNQSKTASTMNDEAADFREARNNAFQKATVAYRRGKSDKLMTAVASYYAEEGHNYNSLAKKAQSDAADLIANSQCSQNSIDLHGLSVQDAVRIAREYVTSWWHELGERSCSGSNFRGSTDSPPSYHIITGTGSHSKDGISKLGPAVSKMLKRDGWKFEVRTGILTVTGISKSQVKSK